MKSIHRYNFYRNKYGVDLPVDVVPIKDFKAFIRRTPIHRLAYFDLTFIVGSSEELILNHCKMAVKRGDILCSFPGQIWSWQENTQLDGFALVFEEEFLLSFFKDHYFLRNLSYLQTSRVSPLLTANEDQFKVLIDHLNSLRSEILKRTDSNIDVLRALLYLILSLLKDCELKVLSDPGEQQINVINRYIESFTALVDANFIERRDLHFYADKLSITVNYLNKITKEVLGSTAKKYILNKTIQESKNLLTYSSISIAEISDRLNIENPSYLFRMFSKHCGMTPKEFRNTNF